jgi:hypothetical protein
MRLLVGRRTHASAASTSDKRNLHGMSLERRNSTKQSFQRAQRTLKVSRGAAPQPGIDPCLQYYYPLQYLANAKASGR